MHSHFQTVFCFRPTYIGLLICSIVQGTVYAQTSEPILEDVIVSGERNSRNLQQTYQGVSVVDGTEPDVTQPGSEINPVIARTPNAFVQGPSELPTIRGVQGGGAGGLNSAAITGAPSRLPLVVDGVTRVPSLVNNSFSSLWDVRQIEVLRGPQSLARGRTGIAGALVIDTQEPTAHYEAAVQAGVRFNDVNDPRYNLNSMVSGQLVDGLLGRATLETSKGHDPRQVVGGNAPFITEYDQLRFRSKVNGFFGNQTSWQLISEYEEGQVPQTRNFIEQPSLTGRAYDDRAIRSNSATRSFDTNAHLLALKTRTAWGKDSFETTASWNKNRFNSVPEQTFPSRLAGDESQLAFDAIYRINSNVDRQQGNWSGLVGIGIEDRDQRFDATGVPLQAAIDVNALNLSTYADFSYALTEKVTLFVGGRLQQYNDERQIATTVLFPPPAAPVRGSTARETDELLFLPSIGLGWDIDDQHSVGASLRRGFTPGGAAINAFSGRPYDYDKETLWTTEITWRYKPSNALRFGTTFFYNDFDNPQVFGEFVPGNRLSLQVFNQKEGRSYGLELDSEWQASSILKLDASVGLLQTEITKASSATPAVQGNEFGQDPNITASFEMNWKFLPKWSADARITHVGKAFNDFNNVQSDQVGDYTIANAGVTYQFSKSELRVFSNNLFDETGFTRFVSGSGADVTEPQEIGVSWTVFFD